MWLLAHDIADYQIIARFQSNKLKTISKIFLNKSHYLSRGRTGELNEVFTDNKKIESIAWKCSFVWGNDIKTKKETM